MPHLIAQGPQRQHRWRRQIPSQEPVLLGRGTGNWQVSWDSLISRSHAQLRLRGRHLEVERCPEATNPIFHNGQAVDHFTLRVGEHFVIGSTRFTLAVDQVAVSLEAPSPVTERAFSRDELKHRPFHDARQQIDALSRLPDLIAGTSSDQELCERLVNLLLASVPWASAVAVVRRTPEAASDLSTDQVTADSWQVLHWDSRDEDQVGSFQPSARLIEETVSSGRSIVCCWPQGEEPSPYTLHESTRWAVCIPLSGASCLDWAIYVAGQDLNIDQHEIGDLLKFVELAASTVGSIRDLRLLQQRTTALSQFFPAPVRDAIVAADLDTVLAPREAQVSVLFCDLRGFSRRTERSRDDLFELLRRVSESLGIMTGQILRHGGVIGDFHGDAAMGFWGWPLADPNQTLHACRAALDIQRDFSSVANLNRHALAGFRIGIGLATGSAVAGRIGTVDQVKVTVFGPVVNVAARLESLTRVFGTDILVDGATMTAIEPVATELGCAGRPLGAVRPYGMDQAIEIFDLLPAAMRSTHEVAIFREAIEHFRIGQWRDAQPVFDRLAQRDAASRFFLQWMAEHRGVPPEDWDGVISMSGK